MSLIEVNGTKLWVERHGDPALPPVLLIHGLFFSGDMYAAQLPLLTRGFHCVTMDLRSIGRSAPALAGMTWTTSARTRWPCRTRWSSGRCTGSGRQSAE